MTPAKSIRKYCLECCNGSVKEVRNCTANDCALYSFRFGKNPNRRGIGGRKKKANLSLVIS
jgi:hypothetical protein